jgi:hypothetical protein
VEQSFHLGVLKGRDPGVDGRASILATRRGSSSGLSRNVHLNKRPRRGQNNENQRITNWVFAAALASAQAVSLALLAFARDASVDPNKVKLGKA